MTGNNPKLDLVNVDVHTKFGQILSIRSQDIERKRNSDVNQGPFQRTHDVKMTSYQRRCDIMTSHRHRSDVILMSCACWDNSVKILRKMTGNNTKLDIVNVDVHTKFGLILSIRSQVMCV